LSEQMWYNLEMQMEVRRQMKIFEYDDVDPSGVLYLNLISLSYSLTQERVALIRRLDPRPLPYFAVYAIEDGIVAGQVAVYRLPMMTSEGPEDVGGVCAVCTHPAFSRHGIAGRLLAEVHSRMLAAGLRFSTLGTARHLAAYTLYQRQGYEAVFTASSTFVSFESVQRESSLRAEPADVQHLPLADALFERVAINRLGFAPRHPGFLPMLVATGDVAADAVWLLWQGNEVAGYAVAALSQPVLRIDHLLVAEGIDAAAAVAAVGQSAACAYAQVRVDHPSVAQSLRRAGFPATRANWSTFMVKPLAPDVTAADARRLFGIGTEQFMISAIDVT
jgi:GNAT superfamily N-acetyltransferase